MLGKFGEALKNAFNRLTKATIIDKATLDAILRELQRALILADVDVRLVADLTSNIKAKISKKLPPGLSLKEHVIRTVYDEIVKFLGSEEGGIELKPQRILLLGLFGSGKTTTAAKLARWFKVRGLNPALVACDTYRPAAKEQLEQLASKIGVKVYKEGKDPIDIAKKALKVSKEDILIFDSAGRDALDSKLAKELKELASVIKPDESLLVIPGDIGQAARKQAEEFAKLVGITGIIVTKLEGTAKGGGALAAAVASGAKVKFIGVGEKIEDFEIYDPKRFISRLIGYGDIKGLLEKAKEVGIEPIERFDLQTFYEQIKGMQKMGSLSKIAEMIPGFSNIKIPKELLDVQEEKMKRWGYAIQSMTEEERRNPNIINASRIKRIAKGSGVSESDVRELLKYYKQSEKFMKMAKGKAFKRGPLARLIKQFGIKI